MSSVTTSQTNLTDLLKYEIMRGWVTRTQRSSLIAAKLRQRQSKAPTFIHEKCLSLFRGSLLTASQDDIQHILLSAQQQSSQRMSERLTSLHECASLIQAPFSHSLRTLLRLNGILARYKGCNVNAKQTALSFRMTVLFMVYCICTYLCLVSKWPEWFITACVFCKI